MGPFWDPLGTILGGFGVPKGCSSLTLAHFDTSSLLFGYLWKRPRANFGPILALLGTQNGANIAPQGQFWPPLGTQIVPKYLSKDYFGLIFDHQESQMLRNHEAKRPTSQKTVNNQQTTSENQPAGPQPRCQQTKRPTSQPMINKSELRILARWNARSD